MPRHRTVIRALVGAAVLTGPVLVPAAPAPAAPPGEVSVYDAWGLRESLRQSNGGTFAGLYAADDGSLVLATTKGNAPAVEASKAAFERRRAGLTVMAAAPKHRVVEVATSLDRLEAVQQKVLDAPGLFDADGPVTMVAVDDPTNTVLIGLTADTQDFRAIVLAATGAAPAELSFEEQEAAESTANRFGDTSPFNAGDRIYDENALAACSSGFGVHQAGTNTDYLLTAAHCSAVAGQQDFFWNGTAGNRRHVAMGFSTNVSFGANGWDTQLIRTESSNITWTAASNRSHITAPYTPIRQDSNKVINEGATSNPWQSGAMTVSLTNACASVKGYPVWGTVRICHLWRAKASAGFCAAKGGDSGGPIVAYTGFGPLAAGQIVARHGCASVLFHAIGDLLARNPHRIPGGLRVNTVSDPG